MNFQEFLKIDNGNCIFYVIALAAVIIFFVFINPKLSNNGIKENFEVALDKCKKLDLLMCSPQCLTNSDWPNSIPKSTDPRIKPGDVGTKYIPTNYTCTGLHGAGGICVNMEAYKTLRHRGENAI